MTCDVYGHENDSDQTNIAHTWQWVLCTLMCYLYKFANYTAWEKWQLEERNHDRAPELAPYAPNAEFQPREPRRSRVTCGRQSYDRL